MPVYTIQIIAFADMVNAANGNVFNNSTVQARGSFAVNPDAEPITLQINDDDPNFEDANQESGGAQTLSAPATINGVTYPVGSIVEYEFSIDLATGETFGIIRINNTNVAMTGTSLPEPGQTYEITGSTDGDDVLYEDVPCFASGTLIQTVGGDRPIEEIVPGDLVRTRDNGRQIVRWIGATTLSRKDLVQSPHLAPVRIRQGALGNTRDLVVSPQHCILFSDWRAQLYFGADNVLVPAKALINGETIIHETGRASVTYLHMLFDRHEIVRSEGIYTESLFPGDFMVEAHRSAAIEELLTLFPELRETPAAYGQTAYPVVRRRVASILA